MDLAPKSLAFLAGAIASAFGAGITFQVWVADRPTLAQLGEAVAPVAVAAKAAQTDAFACRQEIRQLRVDLARFAGRALTDPATRDRGSRSAERMYRQALSLGASPEDAMATVLEADF